MLMWVNKGIQAGSEYLSNLRIADDIVLICKISGEIKIMIGEPNSESFQVGLKMNKRNHKCHS